MGGRPVIVVSRASGLARAQTAECLEAIRPYVPSATDFECRVLETPGDRDKQTPLNDPSVPDDFFTRDLDREVLEGRADLSVHSAKDLPRRMPEGLIVACILPARDPRDALVFRPGLPPGVPPARIGVSSLRREAAMRRLYPSAVQAPLRGTIGERLARLDAGDFDAIVVAACALERLGLADRIGRLLSWPTTPLQGHLAVLCRATDGVWADRLKPADFRLGLAIADDPAVSAPDPVVDPDHPAVLFTGTNPVAFGRLGPLIHRPMIARCALPANDRTRAIEAALGAAHSVLFASAFAVRCFVDALFRVADTRLLRGKILLAAGPATAEELERMGLQADATAEGWGGLASLAVRLPAVAAGRSFYPCSTASPLDERAGMLAAAGIALDPHPFYETVARDPGPLPDAPFDRVAFTSPSTVEAYFAAYPAERTAARRWLAIGPSTLRALDVLNLKGEAIHED